MKNIFVVAVFILGFAAVVSAAPYYSEHQSLLPFVDSKYYLGTTTPSTKAWASVITDEVCLTADTCRTSWPTSGAGGSFPFSADTNYGQQVYSTSTPTLWFKSGLFASSTSYLNNVWTINATTTNLSLHRVYADATDGIQLATASGLDVANFGLGNSQNTLLYGALNVNGATRLATTLTGAVVANSGALTTVATSTTGTANTILGLNGIGFTTIPFASSTAFTATTLYGNGQYLTVPKTASSTLTNLQDFFNLYSVGKFNGGEVTDIGGGQISVDSGSGTIATGVLATSPLVFTDWAASSTITIPTNTNRWIGVEYNGGVPRVVSLTSDTFTYQDSFALAVVHNENGVLHITDDPRSIADVPGQIQRRFHQVFGVQRDALNGGLIISDPGSRGLARTAGALWTSRGLRTPIAATSTATGGFFDTYVGATLYLANRSVWDNLSYNNGGTLASTTANRWSNLWIYTELDGAVIVVYGTSNATSQASAETESAPSTLPLRCTEDCFLNARLTFQRGASSGTIVQAFTTTFAGASASDHTSLSNLLWTSTNHTGTANSVPYFNAGGAAVEFSTSTLSIGGNAGTATALAANGANCAAGFYPLGVTAAGVSEDCTYAFSTTTPWSTGLLAISNAGRGYTIASSTLFGYTPLNPARNITIASGNDKIVSSAGAQDLSADRTWTLTYTGLATTSQPASSNLLVSNGGAGVFGVATGTISAGSSAITVTAGRSAIGGALAIDCAVASDSQAGCLSSANWTTFNNKAGWPFTINAASVYYGQLSNSTTTQMHYGAAPFSLTASSTSVFEYASSTQLSSTGNAYLAISGGKVGIATTTPTGLLSINTNGLLSTTPAFSIGSSTAMTGFGTGTLFAINRSGQIQAIASQPATSTAITLDWSDTPNQIEYQIGVSATTITLINATTAPMWGSRKLVVVCNPNATAGALTWKGLEWIGSAPTQTTTANQCDVYSFAITAGTSTPASRAFKVMGSAGTAFK